MGQSNVNLNINFWKDKLPETERIDYESLLRGFREKRRWGVGVRTSDGNVLTRVITAVLNDNPDLYGIYADRVQVSSGADGTATVTPHFIRVDDRRFARSVNDILSRAPTFKDDYEKALFVKDALADVVRYDYDVIKQTAEVAAGKRDRLDNAASFTAYGAIVERLAACDGIARAACYLLRKLGVQCTVINGKSRSGGERHSWNIVCADGNCYHLDVTNDLLRKEAYYERTYNYFMMTDAEMSEYFISDYGNVVTCDAIADSYYVRNGLRFTCIDDLRRYLLDGAYGEVIAVQYAGDCSDKYVGELLCDAAERNMNGSKRYKVNRFAGGKYFGLIKSKYEKPMRKTSYDGRI